MTRQVRQARCKQLGRAAAHQRNTLTPYEKELVKLLECKRHGVAWHVKQVTHSTFVADFYAKHIKLAVFLSSSGYATKCLHHYGYHVLTIDTSTQTPTVAAERMWKRAKALIEMHGRREIA